MKCRLLFAALAIFASFHSEPASARDVVLPAGTLLQCTLNEPNLSSKTLTSGIPFFVIFVASPYSASKRFRAEAIWWDILRQPKIPATSGARDI